MAERSNNQKGVFKVRERSSHPQGEYKTDDKRKGILNTSEHVPVHMKRDHVVTPAELLGFMDVGAPAFTALDPTGKFIQQRFGYNFNPDSVETSNPYYDRIYDIASLYAPDETMKDILKNDPELKSSGEAYKNAMKLRDMRIRNQFPEFDTWENKWQTMPDEALEELKEELAGADPNSKDNIDRLANLITIAARHNAAIPEVTAWHEAIKNNPNFITESVKPMNRTYGLWRQLMQAAPLLAEDGVQLTDDKGNLLWDTDLSKAKPVEGSIDERFPMGDFKNFTDADEKDVANFFRGALDADGTTIPNEYLNPALLLGANFDPGLGPISNVWDQYRKRRTLGTASDLLDLYDTTRKQDYDSVNKLKEDITRVADTVSPSTAYNTFIDTLALDPNAFRNSGLFMPMMNILRGRWNRAGKGRMYNDEPKLSNSERKVAAMLPDIITDTTGKRPEDMFYTMDMLRGLPITTTSLWPKFNKLLHHMASSRLTSIDPSSAGNRKVKDAERQIEQKKRQLEKATAAGDTEKANKLQGIIAQKEENLAKLRQTVEKGEFENREEPYKSPFDIDTGEFESGKDRLRKTIDEWGDSENADENRLKWVEDMWSEGEDKVDEKVNRFVRNLIDQLPSYSFDSPKLKPLSIWKQMYDDARKDIAGMNYVEGDVNKGESGHVQVGEKTEVDRAMRALMDDLWNPKVLTDEATLEDYLKLIEQRERENWPERVAMNYGDEEKAEKQLQDMLSGMRVIGMDTIEKAKKRAEETTAEEVEEAEDTGAEGAESTASSIMSPKESLWLENMEAKAREVRKRSEAFKKLAEEDKKKEEEKQKAQLDKIQSTSSDVDFDKMTEKSKEIADKRAEEDKRYKDSRDRKRSAEEEFKLRKRLEDIRGQAFQQHSNPTEQKNVKKGAVLRKGTETTPLPGEEHPAEDQEKKTAVVRQQRAEADRAEAERKRQQEQADRAEQEAYRQRAQAEKAEIEALNKRLDDEAAKKKKVVVKVKPRDVKIPEGLTGNDEVSKKELEKGISDSVADTIADMARGY